MKYIELIEWGLKNFNLLWAGLRIEQLTSWYYMTVHSWFHEFLLSLYFREPWGITQLICCSTTVTAHENAGSPKPSHGFIVLDVLSSQSWLCHIYLFVCPFMAVSYRKVLFVNPGILVRHRGFHSWPVWFYNKCKMHLLCARKCIFDSDVQISYHRFTSDIQQLLNQLAVGLAFRSGCKHVIVTENIIH